MEIKPLKDEKLIKVVEDWSSIIDLLDLPEDMIISFNIFQRVVNGEEIPYPDEDDSVYGFDAFVKNKNGTISTYMEVSRAEKPFVQPEEQYELTGTPKVLMMLAEYSNGNIDRGWIMSRHNGFTHCSFSWNPEKKEYDHKYFRPQIAQSPKNLKVVEEILFNGTKEQMEDLPSSVSYVYNEKNRSFMVRFGFFTSKSLEVHSVPNCANLYGNSYRFFSLDEITNKLLDGTKNQISSLAGLPIWYEYNPKSKSLTIKYGKIERRMHKLESTPSCVEFFGNSHSFRAEAIDPKLE